MRHLFRIALTAVSFVLAGCAAFGGVPLNAGEPESNVLAKLGTPTHRYQDGQDLLLEYMHGPWGQTTYMARIGPDKRLISYEQVLTLEKFGQIQRDRSTKEDVLHIIGAPSGTSYLSLPQLEVWTYPYKESNVWNSLMHVHFDNNGIVRKMQNGPDPRFEPDLNTPIFGMGRF